MKNFPKNKKPELSILSSRPAMGKTSFAIQLATTVADDIKVLYVSNETIENKIIANLTGIDLRKIISTELKPNEVLEIENKKELLNRLRISTIENLQLTEINSISIIRENIFKHKAELVFIDGINWRDFKAKQYSMQNYISYFEKLRDLTIEFNIEIIVLHELDRTVEKKGNGSKPDLSDLINESFLIDLASSIQFLYRPKYYGLQYASPEFKDKHILEVVFAKDDNDKHPSYMYFEINTEFNQFSPRT